ncbi:transposase [Candidatus Palauibacter sp.]|uniref:transposase n=2 Tax=Candidatus Palauibacter sp. TaxID=3101350 RepID=UPI003AF3128C
MVRVNDYTGPRPHVQGSAAALRVRGGGGRITDAGGLVVVRKLWDALGLGGWIDGRAGEVPGRYRPSLMVESWVVLLLYGGGAMDDLPLLDRRGVRRIFGWARVPHPATFGRWLRCSAAVMSPLLDELLWRMVRRRWEMAGGAPRSATIVMDSTVVVRYGLKQAGAERGYNPKKPGRPSHHPLLAYVLETGDCLGVRWRPGNAHTARGAEAWLAGLVARLRGAGVRRITVRLDKGFFSKSIARRMEALGVSYLLKVPRHAWLGGFRGAWETAARDEAGDRELRTASGELWGTRLLSVERRRRIGPEEGELDLAAWETTTSADVLTNIEGIGPVEAWRAYNAGAVVEQRIGELGQLSAGRTAVDDLGGNALLWSLAVLAYQLLHILRANCLGGRWRAVQPRGIRLRLLRAPREDHLPRPPNLARVRARRTGPRPPAAGAPNHRAGSPAARARLNLTGPNPGFPKAPRGGAHSPCLREPPGTPPEPRRPSAEARSGPENATARAKSPQPPVIIALRPPDYAPTQDPGSNAQVEGGAI